ncbi:MAG: radical SAM protein [Planctomycetota bacterium]
MTKPRLVLYQPQQVDKSLGQFNSYDILPLEMLHIGALPDREGYDVVLIDASLYSLEDAHRIALEKCEGAAVFATTAILGYMVADGHLAASKVRERYPDIKIIAGGWFPTCLPEAYLSTGVYDAICLGQGEVTFLEFVEAVTTGSKLEDVAGLALWRDGQVVETERRPIVGWNVLPRAAWHLIDIEPYRKGQLSPHARAARNHMPTPPRIGAGKPYFGVSYFSSYGCPEPCTFCCSPFVTNQRWKAMPAEMMLDDMQELHERWKFDVIRFQDANWGVFEKRAKEFAQGMLDRGMRFEWSTTIEVHSILRYKKESLDLLKDAGLYLVCVGAEAAEQGMIDRVKKKIQGDDTLRAAREMHERDIITSLTYIIGYPGETEESMLATIDQAREIISHCPSVSAHVYPFRPIPGNAMFDQSIELGYQPPKTLLEWGSALEYHVMDTWKGNIPEHVKRRWRLYYQYASFFHGLVRPKRGLIERISEWRIRSGNYSLPLELRAFYAMQKLVGKKAHREDEKQTWIMSREDEAVAMVK